MNQKDTPSTCDNQLGVCGLDPEHSYNKRHKPIELYTFIDPLCADCWAFEPMLKKLLVEYGNYFRIRTLVAGRLQAWNVCKHTSKGLASKKQAIASIWEETATKTGMSCDGDVLLENEWHSPYLASVAIKAAELQGPQLGARFLRKMREALFLNKENITQLNILVNCANKAGLDVAEFQDDLSSKAASKALQHDLQTTNEMGVDMVPTFVFFNANVEDDGIKVTGNYPYDVYVQILEDMLGFTPTPSKPPSLEEFLLRFELVATIEISVVFNISEEEAEKRLKALMLQQKVEAVPVKYGTFWRYLK